MAVKTDDARDLSVMRDVWKDRIDNALYEELTSIHCNHCGKKVAIFKHIKMFGKERVICFNCRFLLIHELRGN